jgi:hypothetical protein
MWNKLLWRQLTYHNLCTCKAIITAPLTQKPDCEFYHNCICNALELASTCPRSSTFYYFSLTVKHILSTNINKIAQNRDGSVNVYMFYHYPLCTIKSKMKHLHGKCLHHFPEHLKLANTNYKYLETLYSNNF